MIYLPILLFLVIKINFFIMTPTHAQIIQALLFTSGETWRFSELMETLSIDRDILDSALLDLDTLLEAQGIMTIIHNDTVTLVTRPEVREILTSLETAETTKEFSKGAVETLALIAYRGPISKSDIDYIRGVNSQFMLRNLVMRGMIEKQSATSRGSGYVVTTDALRFLGVASPDELPEYASFVQEIEKRIPVTESEPIN